jgi:hypothetical protein
MFPELPLDVSVAQLVRIHDVVSIICSTHELLYDWRFTANQFVLATSPLRLTTNNSIFQLNTYCYDPYNCCWPSPAQSFSGPSHTGLMTTFYSIRFEDSPNLEGQVTVFISPRNRVAQLYP